MRPSSAAPEALSTHTSAPLGQDVAAALSVALIAPARSDGPAASLEELAEALPEGARLLDLPQVDDEAPDAWAARAVAAGATLLVAAGGDGTTAAVARAALGRPHVGVAIVPAGTSNSIAAHFGLTSREQALACLRAGRWLTIDTAVCNGAPMLLMATLGVHAEAVLDAAPESKAWLGVLAYAYEELVRVIDHEKLEAELVVDDFRLHVRASAITIANLGPEKSPLVHGAGGPIEDDGLLDVTVVDLDGLSDGVLTMFHLARCARDKSPASASNVIGLRAREVHVHTRDARRVMVDGEEAGAGDVHVQIVPQSLRLWVPTEYQARGT